MAVCVKYKQILILSETKKQDSLFEIEGEQTHEFTSTCVEQYVVLMGFGEFYLLLFIFAIEESDGSAGISHCSKEMFNGGRFKLMSYACSTIGLDAVPIGVYSFAFVEFGH